MVVQLTSIKKFEQVPAKLPEKKCFFKNIELLPRLMRYIIIYVCIGLVMRQVAECITKLVKPPISTYTHFDFNKTIEYPSLTFCREPAYKFNELAKHGLYAHPRYTSMWQNFNFSKTSLEDLWQDITYNETEIFIQYGLDGKKSNVKLTSTYGFVTGRCFTMSSKVLATRATSSSGYSVTLQHNREDIANSISNNPPGYLVFVHNSKEPFTEVEVYNGGLVDTLQLKIGETLDVKLTVDEYKKLDKENDPCIMNKNSYSTNACTARFVWDTVGDTAGCSGPWMKSDLPPCNNHTSMTRLISSYMNTYKSHNCSCPRVCNSHLYSAYVTDRHMYRWDVVTLSMVSLGAQKSNADLQIQLFVHFNGMMVSIYEERYNYNWSNFVSDLGGSIGFLLGLSVISLMAFLAQVWAKLLEQFLSKKSRNQESTVPTRELNKYLQDGTWKH